ncbi:MAG: ATP-binding protein [Micavibrio sp.]|nr:MAG: ATP-binding protein [Micavibrio sp.]
MLSISLKEVTNRLDIDNPWWHGKSAIEEGWPKRAYFPKFYALAAGRSVKRATIMMGPRRVGKTVMLLQTVMELIHNGVVPAKNILFVSMDAPVYVGLSLEQMVSLFTEHNSHTSSETCYVFFDEIQYLKDWEIHLKDLVDRYPHIKFIASGSAAAALKLKSRESGAGRFTDFMLPPLTFAEFVHFSEKDHLIVESDTSPTQDYATDIHALNRVFIEYLNFGGYPEVVLNKDIRDKNKRYIKQDIIDKVLLRDLPSLYGINDIQELNRLFTVLAYNTGNEVSLEGLSKDSNVSKPQLKKYLEYLEAAFLIVTVTKLNESGKHFKRQRQFKVYLTNPSMRAALFSPITEDDEGIGALTETAIFCQWFHSPEMENIHYARWKGGEVDLVKLDNALKPVWAYEIKWSDRYFDQPQKLSSLVTFSKKGKLSKVGCSTKTKSGIKTTNGVDIAFFPASLHCYQVARRVTAGDN